MPVLSDAVTRAGADFLGFDRYIDPLIRILVHEDTETPFTIGIFGAWGSGKSTLLSMLDERLGEEFEESFVRVQFNPWMTGAGHMLVPLLHALHDTLTGDKKSRFVESAKKIGDILLRLGADVFLKHITSDAVSLKKIEKLEERYLAERRKLESEIRNLRATLQEQMDAIKTNGARVVVFIDDLDRCEPDEIIDVLEAAKLFFDLRHVFIVLAIDKEVVDRGIEIRYGKFKFADERAPAIGAEYLEKMVQLPLQLFPLHQAQVRGFIEKLCVRLKPPNEVATQVALLEKLCAPNPRKIKRILNILSVTMRMAAALQLDAGTVARLVVLQVQHGDLYANVVQNPGLLVALELVYAGVRKIDDLEDYARFKTRRTVIQKLTKKFYRADGHLPAIFGAPHPEGSGSHPEGGGSRFVELEDKLPTYLSLLGG